MRILSAVEVNDLLPAADAVPLMAHAFRQFSSHIGAYPLRSHLRLTQPDGDALAMSAYDGGHGLGVKLVTVHSSNRSRGLPTVRALYLLARATDGEPLMLCDGTALTAVRTGAASGVATDILARREARRGALFGVGGQALAQLQAVLSVRSLESVAVYAPHPRHVTHFCEGPASALATRLVPVAVPDDAVRDADIVITATSSGTPVFDGRLLKAGAHVNAVGAYRPETRELDDNVVRRARVYVDSREAALAEAGDLVIPLQAGTIDPSHIEGEIGEVLLGHVEGRRHADEITLFKSVGLPVQDVVAALELYRRAVAGDAGAEVAL